MLDKLRSLLRGQARRTSRAPVHTPGLYPVGNTTVETDLRRLLAAAPRAHSSPDGPAFQALLGEDVVAAAILLAQTVPGAMPADATALIPVLTRCITGSVDDVRFADAYMAEGDPAGVSALASPLLLQVLVAVAFKHRHKAMLGGLLSGGRAGPRPARTLFRMASDPSVSFADVLGDPNYGRQAWALLVEAGWADHLPGRGGRDDPPDGSANVDRPDPEAALRAVTAAAAQSRSDPAAALAVVDDLVRRGWDPQPYTGSVLSVLVREGTADMLAHVLPCVSRALFTGVPPQPRWPGEPVLVTMAAARGHRTDSADSADEALRVLRVLVDVGALDIPTAPGGDGRGLWYKRGPDDEHPAALLRSTRLPDGSCADDPPLVAAVHAGNRAAVLYLLRKGVAARRAGVLAEARARARERHDDAMLALLERWGEGEPPDAGKGRREQ